MIFHLTWFQAGTENKLEEGSRLQSIKIIAQQDTNNYLGKHDSLLSVS